MHLVFLNQYYPPDAAPTGVVLRDLADAMVRQGHEVTVLCAAGGYAGEEGEGGVVGCPLSVVGELELAPKHHDKLSSQTTDNRQRTTLLSPLPTILRIGATRFGRGTFIGKLADYASYYLGVTWKLMWMSRKPDRVIALTTPPYLSVLARIMSKLRGGDHAHWVMDMYPDVMVAHGMLKESNPLCRMLGWLARWGMGGSRCAAIVTLGPDMAGRLRSRLQVSSFKFSVSSSKEETEETEEATVRSPSSHSKLIIQNSKFNISWVPLWGGVEVTDVAGDGMGMAVGNRRHGRGWADDELVVMYSGNMGLGHRFGEILEVARRRGGEELSVVGGRLSVRLDEREAPPQALCSDNGQPTTDHAVRFVFYGGGKRRVEVETFARENPECKIELHDYAPAADLAVHLRSADVHLVSLDPAWTGTMVPSKLQGIFAAGRPVIFIGSEESSIGRWVKESGAGWVLRPDDVTGLLGALHEARDPQTRATRGNAAKHYANEHFDKTRNVTRLVEMLGGARLRREF